MTAREDLGLEPPQYEVIYTMQNEAGELTEITSATLTRSGGPKTEWTMLSELSKTIKVAEGYEPPVHDFPDHERLR